MLRLALIVWLTWVSASAAWPPRLDRHGIPLPAGAVARLGTLQLRHGEQVSCLAFTPDGKQLISGSRLGDLRLWEVSTGREVRSLPGHRLGTHALAISADGRTLISAGGEPAIRVHDLTTGRDTILEAQQDEVWAVALSGDGKTLAVGDRSGKARLLDLTTGKPKLTVGDFQAGVASIALSPDGQTLATAGSGSCGVRLWNTSTGKQRRVILVDDALTPTVAFTPDGKGLLTTGSSVRLWDARTGQRQHELFKIEDGLPSAAFSPDGNLIAVTGIRGAQEVRLFDVSAGREETPILGGEWGASSVAFSPDSRLLALGTFEGVIRIVNVASGKDEHAGLGHTGPLSGISFAPNGKTLATAGGRTVRLWDPIRATMVRELEHPDVVASVVFSPDGRLLAAGGGGERGQTGRSICLWTPRSGKLLGTIANQADMEDVRSLAFSPDGRLLAWAGGATSSPVRLWDLIARKETEKPEFDRIGAQAVAISPDNRMLAAVDRGNSIHAWDLEPLNVRPPLGKHEGTVTGLLFAPHGQMLATSSKDGTVRVWEMLTGQELFRLAAHDGVGAIAFTKDGKFLFTGGTDGKIRLWHVFTASLMQTWEGHRAEVTGLALSPDGRMLASCSRDTTALLWRIEEGDLMGPPPRVLAAEELERMWNSLTAADATEAYRAIGGLATAPEQAGAYLDQRLKATIPTGAKVRQTIADLDARRYRTRKNAQEELEKWGQVVVPLIEEALRGGPSLELRRRSEEVLRNLELRDHKPELIRLQRSLRVLELIGTPRARAVLEELVALDVPGAKNTLLRMKGP